MNIDIEEAAAACVVLCLGAADLGVIVAMEVGRGAAERS
jgi:hypothetical protein